MLYICAMRRTNDPSLKDLRRVMRNEPTFAEKMLWYSLRGSQLDGRKFRRQHGIGPYIVDFYCAEEKLIVELDGDVHDEPMVHAHDVERQEWLEQHGHTVLRFTNEQVLSSSNVVLDQIRVTWQGRERQQAMWKANRSRATRARK
jgi:5-methyltetrahydrofolate--homocysteine methyltransferase